VTGGTGGAGAGFPKALGGGLAGAILGVIVYYIVRAATGYEIGIIAIAVGWLAGKGVSWGSGRRGGPRYQALAIGLTYLGIVATHVPAVGFAAAVLARPLLAGAENVVGLIIIGIGLYEAWKINRTRTPDPTREPA
jgi:hypothetical protein